MPAVIDATAGGPTANSYATHAEANTYFEARMPLTPAWVTSGQEVVLIMACRVLNSQLQPLKTFVAGSPPYYRVRRTWTGQPATNTQRLPWPRIGMYDANGNPIPSNVIPQELKDAQSELAGQLRAGTATVESGGDTSNIASVKAGSVSVSFRAPESGAVQTSTQVIPDSVYDLMPPSWFTDEGYESAMPAQFDVLYGD